jgi:hypothetical protein
MATVEVSRTLVKSPPELWADLVGGRLEDVFDDVRVTPTQPERELAWEARGVRGTATLEASGWGTRLTLTAELREGG